MIDKCIICGSDVAKSRASSSLMCAQHQKMWEEDINIGLHKQNRLKDIININKKQEEQQ